MRSATRGGWRLALLLTAVLPWAGCGDTLPTADEAERFLAEAEQELL